jgi:hypothetical protein
MAKVPLSQSEKNILQNVVGLPGADKYISQIVVILLNGNRVKVNYLKNIIC